MRVILHGVARDDLYPFQIFCYVWSNISISKCTSDTKKGKIINFHEEGTAAILCYLLYKAQSHTGISMQKYLYLAPTVMLVTAQKELYVQQ